MEIFPLAKTDLGPAAKTLVEKIASATGALYAPLGTVFQALADVSSDKIRAKGKIEAKLVRRLERLAAEETKKQNNLEAIYGQTFQLLNSEADIAKIKQMDEDWIVFHSEKARLVSDKEMQTLWARIVASESEAPGSYSKRTLDMLSVLEKAEAHLFTSVCRFIVRYNSEANPVILCEQSNNCPSNVYTDLGLNPDTLLHLSAIGLVHYNRLSCRGDWIFDRPAIDLEYFGDRRTILISEIYGKYMLDFGIVSLTQVGRQLAGIAGAEPVEGFLDFLETEWAKRVLLEKTGTWLGRTL
jgi:Protein of unknown function (DUF2806)